jgi:hypothetical protein
MEKNDIAEKAGLFLGSSKKLSYEDFSNCKKC